jgi:acetyl-CoA carboxylase biotin carboxyl carrier protein
VADPKKVRAEANALVQELLTRLDATDVRELEIKRGGIRVKVSKGVTTRQLFTDPGAIAPAANAPVAPPRSNGPSLLAAETNAQSGNAITAPLTGIFYRSPSPQAPAFVQIGSAVAAGDVIGLIEAMKLFNEIRSTKNGKVKKIVAENGQLVRAHQPLIELEPA